MSRIVDQAIARVEDQRLDRLPESAKSAVQKVDHLPIEDAKERVGRAIRSAIGDEPLRVYGDASFVAKVMSGEKVPDYMARIVTRPESLRRYALSLLEGEQGVEVETTVRIRRRA